MVAMLFVIISRFKCGISPSLTPRKGCFSNPAFLATQDFLLYSYNSHAKEQSNVTRSEYFRFLVINIKKK